MKKIISSYCSVAINAFTLFSSRPWESVWVCNLGKMCPSTVAGKNHKGICDLCVGRFCLQDAHKDFSQVWGWVWSEAFSALQLMWSHLTYYYTEM